MFLQEICNQVQWYGIFIYLGVILTYLLLEKFLKKNNLDKKIDLPFLFALVYIGSFLGGKFFYFIIDHGATNITTLISSIFKFSLKSDASIRIYENLFGGFSLIGASTTGILILLFYSIKKNLFFSNIGFIPIFVLLIHGLGRIGCFFSRCCGGLFFGYPIQIISSLFYFFFFIAFLTYKKNHQMPLPLGTSFYITIIFLERFLFDPFRDDCINTSYYITKYQLISILYFITINTVIILLSFYSNSNKK